MADLAKVNGDLGRVAGLLKLWLIERGGRGVQSAEVEATMHDLRMLQNQILELIGKVVRDH